MPETQTHMRGSQSNEEVPVGRTALSAFIKFLSDEKIVIGVAIVFLLQSQETY